MHHSLHDFQTDPRLMHIHFGFTGLDWRLAPSLEEQAVIDGLRRGRQARAQAFGAELRRLAGVLRSLSGRIRETLRRRRMYRDTYRALMALDDWQLRDIGLYRGEILRVCNDLTPSA